MGLVREDNLLGLQPRQFVVTTDSNHTLEVALNLARRLQLSGLDQLWGADITYIQVWSEFVFLAVGLDPFSRKVAGWAFARKIQPPLGFTALDVVAHQRAAAPRLAPHCGP